MRRRVTGLLLTGFVGLAACGPNLAAGRWQTSKPAGERRMLPKGKTLLQSHSPNRRLTLLVRDEGEKGDFFWRTLYVRQGGSYTRLLTANEVRSVRWLGSPARVRFTMDAATGPSEMTRSEVIYTPSTRTIQTRMLRKLQVEGAG
ncbi:MAG TPA: hypothetical protein VK689_02765 [Armatimonadota bacterium]|nr:hypothetical protein [Armatimonadota bacterium]